MKKVVVLLAMGLAALASAQELVTNGGFETGSFSGWTQWGDTSFSGVSDSGFNPPHSGLYSAHFGPTTGIGGIRQTLTAPAGSTVAVEFWYYDDTGTGVLMNVTLGGQTLLNLPNGGPPSWTQFSQNVTVPVNNPVLEFGFTNPPTYWYLDDVSVVIPEPASLLLLGLATLLRRR